MNLSHAYHTLAYYAVSSSDKMEKKGRSSMRKLTEQYKWIINLTARNPNAILIISLGWKTRSIQNAEVLKEWKSLMDYAKAKLGEARIIEARSTDFRTSLVSRVRNHFIKRIMKKLDKNKSIKIRTAGEYLDQCAQRDVEDINENLIKAGLRSEIVETRLAGIVYKNFQNMEEGPTYYKAFRKRKRRTKRKRTPRKRPK